MIENWNTYTRTIENNPAILTYNHGYSGIADNDKRDTFLSVKLRLKNPTGNGLPTVEEYLDLSLLDDHLNDELNKLGSVPVGQITADGYRYIYFYTDISEEQRRQVARNISDSTGYQLDYGSEYGPEKAMYFVSLYPTSDEFRTIMDMSVLDALKDSVDP